MNKNITIQDKYGPAMAITEQQEADAYLEQCVQHTMGFGRTREEAESIERQNLGYYAGYYSHEVRLRVERLFHCSHPIFGKATSGEPSPEYAFALGEAEAILHEEEK